MASGGARAESSFDFQKLCETFSQICPDFKTFSSGSETSQSLDFVNKVLFELGPKMRHIKQSGQSEMWRLVFQGGDSVLIYSYTFPNPINVNPRVKDKKLYMTLKQAGLLAISKLCSALPDQHNPSQKILLTPLARAVFEPSSISKIATALSAHFERRVDSGEVVKAVISSCQTDGFHLQYSRCHVALVAIEVTVQSAVQRNKLREKTLRQYSKHGKSFDAAQYKIYAAHSKLDKRSPDVELTTAITSNPDEQQHNPVKSITTVLRSIARTVDDPLSGGTIDISYVDTPKPQAEMPTPIVIQVVGTSIGDLKWENLLPKHIKSAWH